MKVVKDNIAIYTNRAQTLILLGKYMEAINDCDWALRVLKTVQKIFKRISQLIFYFKAG